jgi:hypothetical protein
MTNIEILRTYNDWRRDRTGNRTLEDFGITPRMIGEALDAVIKDAERIEYLERKGKEECPEQESLRNLVDIEMAKESRQ